VVDGGALMNIRIETGAIEQIECDALAVVVFDKESPGGSLAWEVTKVVNGLAGKWI